MREYEFTLKFALSEKDQDIDILVERLGEAGCTDALVGIGQAGRIGLDFTREATSAMNAIVSAYKDVKTAIPDAVLVEASPDMVGLTDVADFVGVSRQYMRKLVIETQMDFPTPIHEGTPTIWHLSSILNWFRGRGEYKVDLGLIEIAEANMHFNLVKELHAHKTQRSVEKDLHGLFAM